MKALRDREFVMIEVIIFNYPIKVWELLAVIGVVLAALEIFIPGFVVLPIGIAFLAAAVAAVFLPSMLMILIALAISLCFLIWVFQFKLKANRKMSSVIDTNADGMVGKEVTITEEVGVSDAGEVKLYGDRWRAYSISKRTYEVGEKAFVVKVDGNKLALD